MLRSGMAVGLVTVTAPLLAAPPSIAGPGDPPVTAVFPANGASVPLNPNGVEVRYTCPEAYIIAGEPPFATYGGRDDYGVDFASAPALGNNGRLLESNVIDRAGDDPIQDNDIPIGQCRGYLTRATGPGVVYWQAWRLCLACPGSYETAEVRSMRLTTSGSGLRIAAKWPRTAYARYPFHVWVTSSGIRAGTTVELQARRGTRWRREAGPSPASAARVIWRDARPTGGYRGIPGERRWARDQQRSLPALAAVPDARDGQPVHDDHCRRSAQPGADRARRQLRVGRRDLRPRDLRPREDPGQPGERPRPPVAAHVQRQRRLDGAARVNHDPERPEDRLQALIDASPLALVEFGLDTCIRLWNPAAERIFGWTAEEILGRGGLPLAPPQKRAEAEDLFERVLSGESINDYETVRLHKDGSLVPVSIAAATVTDSSGRGVGNMVAYTDITERKAQEAEVHRLNAELHARLEDLAASRARIVTAGDVERRRLERNLHDGAQQRLVTVSLSLRLALGKLESDSEAARATLADARDELAIALDELRELARGLHPAVLVDHGLGAAIELLAGRAPVAVELAEIPDERLPEPVEAAAYYLIAEALTNVAKYARASNVRIRVTPEGTSVVVEVSDDGVGGADPVNGSGLRGLADRVEALGGSLHVHSPAGGGTSLRAEIPRAPGKT